MAVAVGVEVTIQDLVELVEVLLYHLERMELVELVVLLAVVQVEQIQVVEAEDLGKEIMLHTLVLVVMVVRELLLSDIGINNVKIIR